MKRFGPSSILSAVDFSPATPSVLDAAVALAERFDARIHLVHVWRLPTAGVLDGVTMLPDAREIELLTTSLRDELRGAAETASFPRERIDTHLVQGDAAISILEVATQSHCDLIVMGTHGRTGLPHLVMGSVSEHVVRRSRVPVLIVPMPRK
jgi:nucleotide-binding universal stress UspA family protein